MSTIDLRGARSKGLASFENPELLSAAGTDWTTSWPPMLEKLANHLALLKVLCAYKSTCLNSFVISLYDLLVSRPPDIMPPSIVLPQDAVTVTSSTLCGYGTLQRWNPNYSYQFQRLGSHDQ